MHQDVLSYIQQHQQRFLNELIELLKIPSVSADSRHANDCIRAAEYLKDMLSRLGFDKVELLPTNGFPLVYAEKIIDPKLPTVLVYGHYDVQPPDPLDLWESPPFEPVIKDEKIYARGACDDKGQLFMHVKAFEVLSELQQLSCNVKFVIEGEEEIGSANLEDALERYQQLFKADLILISDTSMLANDKPSICIGLRGLSYLEVEVTGPNRDLHSGVYGGAVDNPINVLCEMVSSLKDENRRVTIPGFYDDVIELSDDARQQIANVPFDKQEYLDHLNIADTRGETGYNILEQASIRPTLDVNGIWGGYTGEGSKTVIASKAYAKISMRLVANQKSDHIAQLFKTHFEAIAPKTVTVKVKFHHGGDPYLTDTNTRGYQAAAEAMEQTFGKRPLALYEGGSIPILALFNKYLKCPIILMGFGLNTDAIHSPNEHFGLFNFYKGIETISLFYPAYVRLEQEALISR
jgi:acetylornithine deacetylase/succinyl-diaminopimelate desuccinylase-like protein